MAARFVPEDSAAIGYSCLSPCVYERDDQPGTAFCFAQDDQQVGVLGLGSLFISILSQDIVCQIYLQVVCGDSPGLEGEYPPISRDHFFQSGPLCLPIHIMQANTIPLVSLNVSLSLS